MTWHAKPMLPLIGLPWQHSNASQSGWVFVLRKAVLIWQKHLMDNPPVRDVHMIIEGQRLKVRKGQYVRLHSMCQNIFQALITQYVDELM